MKNFLVHIICFFLFSSHITPVIIKAQDISYFTNFETFDGGKGLYGGAFIEEDENHFYTPLTQKDARLEAINGRIRSGIIAFTKDSLKEVSINYFEAKKKLHTENLILKDFYFSERNFLLFVSDYHHKDKSQRNYILNADRELQELEPRLLGTIHFDKDIKTIIDTKKNTFYGFKKLKTYKNSFLYWQLEEGNISNPCILKVLILGSKGELLHQEAINIPYDKEFLSISEIMLSGRQLFFSISIKYPFIEPLYQLVSYDINSNEVNFYKFSYEDLHIRSIETYRFKSGEILLYGKYSEEKEEEKIKGMYGILFSNDNEEIRLRMKIDYRTNTHGLIHKKDFQHLEAKNFYLLNDSGLMVILEYEWEELLKFKDSEYHFYQKPVYHSGPVMLTRINNKGETEWSRMLVKHQKRHDRDYNGFLSQIKDDGIWIIYNDHPGNSIDNTGSKKTMKNRFILRIAHLDINNAQLSSVNTKGLNSEDIIFREGSAHISEDGTILLTQEGSPQKYMLIHLRD